MPKPKWVRQLTPTQTENAIRKLKLRPDQLADKGLMEALKLTIESSGHVSPEKLGKMIRQTTVEHERRQANMQMQHSPTRLLNPNDPLAQTLARLFAMIYSALLLEVADENEEHKSDDTVEEQNIDVANDRLALALEITPVMAAELAKLDPEQLEELDRSMYRAVELHMKPRPEPGLNKRLSEYVLEMAPALTPEAKPELGEAPSPGSIPSPFQTPVPRPRGG